MAIPQDGTYKRSMHSFRRAVLPLAAILPVFLAGCSELLPHGSIEEVKFEALVPPDTSNRYLVCPSDICVTASPDRESPVFDIGVNELRMAWERIVDRAQRSEVVASFRDGGQVAIVQRSAVLKFPDIISAEFVDLGRQRATVLIYSRSVYGLSDFGVNRDRVDRWLDELNAEVGGARR